MLTSWLSNFIPRIYGCTKYNADQHVYLHDYQITLSYNDLVSCTLIGWIPGSHFWTLTSECHPPNFDYAARTLHNVRVKPALYSLCQSVSPTYRELVKIFYLLNDALLHCYSLHIWYNYSITFPVYLHPVDGKHNMTQSSIKSCDNQSAHVFSWIVNKNACNIKLNISNYLWTRTRNNSTELLTCTF